MAMFSALLKRIYPAASFTLVGDLYQGIHADEGIHGWEEWEGPVFGHQVFNGEGIVCRVYCAFIEHKNKRINHKEKE